MKHKENKIVWGIVAFLFCLIGLMGNSYNDYYNVNERTRKAVMAAFEDDNWQRIVDLCDRIYDRRGTVKDMTLIFATALENTNQHRKAVRVLNDQIAIEPENYYLYQTLGEIHQRRNESDEAIKAYQKAIEMAPAYARPYVYLGKIYQKKEENDEAIKNYLQAIELFVNHDYYSEIIEYGSEILKMDEKHERTLMLLQYAYMKKDQNREALEVGKKLDAVLAEKGDNELRRVNSLFMGLAAYDSKDYELALNLLTTAMKKREGLEEYWYMACCYLSATYSKLGDDIASQKYRDMAIKIEPKNAEEYIDWLIGPEKDLDSLIGHKKEEISLPI